MEELERVEKEWAVASIELPGDPMQCQLAVQATDVTGSEININKRSDTAWLQKDG